MINCHQVTRLVSESQERQLGLKERMSLKMHVAMCSACRNFSRQIPFIHDSMRAYADGRDEESEI